MNLRDEIYTIISTKRDKDSYMDTMGVQYATTDILNLLARANSDKLNGGTEAGHEAKQPQQLKAEIAALATELFAVGQITWDVKTEVNRIATKLRQLSAVQNDGSPFGRLPLCASGDAKLPSKEESVLRVMYEQPTPIKMTYGFAEGLRDMYDYIARQNCLLVESTANLQERHDENS